MNGVCLLLSLVWASLPRVAHAAEEDPAAAELMFERGRSSMDQKDYDAACEYFEASLRLQTAVGTLLNLADCQEKRGNLVTAWNKWEMGLRMLEATDRRREFVNQRLEVLSDRVPMVAFHLSKSATHPETEKIEVVRDGQVVKQLEKPVLLNPGEHEVLVHAAGHSPQLYRFALEEGERRELLIRPGPPIDEGIGGRRRHRILAWSATGVGVVGAGMAVGTGLLLPRQKRLVEDHCEDNQCDSVGIEAAEHGKRLLTLNTIGWGVAGLGLISGSVLFITLPHDKRSSSHSAARLDLNLSGTRLLITGTF